MATPARDPALALDHLTRLSPDIRGALLVGPAGRLAAASGIPEAGEGALGPAADLLTSADAAATAPLTQLEVTTEQGSVFLLREKGWVLTVLAERLVLPSLMFLDMRKALSDGVG